VDRDLDSQAMFINDNFFSVGGKIVSEFYKRNKRAKITVSMSTHLMIHNRVDSSNKCLLKISLISIPQKIPNKINSDSIIQTLMTDYAGQKNLKVKFEDETVALSSKSDCANKSELSSLNNLYLSKHVRVKDFDGLGSGFESNSVNSSCLPKQVHSDASEGSVGTFYAKEVNDHADFCQKDDAEESVNNSSY
ncbi:12144_t:CDS:2, partial [Cetraspora pellucida]